MRIKC